MLRAISENSPGNTRGGVLLSDKEAWRPAVLINYVKFSKQKFVECSIIFQVSWYLFKVSNNDTRTDLVLYTDLDSVSIDFER